MNYYKKLRLLILAGALCVFGESASAGTLFDVRLDTTALAGHPAQPFSVLLIFTDGDGIGDGNNTVTIDNVTFGGGSASGGQVVFGGASGSLAGGIAITDVEFLSLFSEQFVPGSELRFRLGLTQNGEAGGVPDRLTFSILDGSGILVPTLAPAGDYFFGVDLTPTGPVFDAYGSDPGRSLSVGDAVSIAAPSVSEVPEPGTLVLLGAPLSVFLLLRRRLRGGGKA